MSLPSSFAAAGFGPAPKRLRRLMIGTEGESGSGKSEFMASAPGPGIIMCIDRNFEAMLDNPNPPKARNEDFAYKIIQLPLDSQENKEEYLKRWRAYKETVYNACKIPECRTIGIDTDNVAWDLQLLADFGRLAQIPQMMRTATNTARKAFIARLNDSGKNIIASNMLKDEWADVIDDDGHPVLKDGKKTQTKTGERTRQGHPDQSYLWQVQLRHLFKPGSMVQSPPKEVKLPNGKVIKTPGKPVRAPAEFGIRILKCTRNMDLVGEELWGNSANFAGLVSLIYPETPLSAWGL